MKNKEQKRREAYERRTARWVNLAKVGVLPSIADLKRAVSENPYNNNSSHQMYMDAEVKYMHALLCFKPSLEQVSKNQEPAFCYQHSFRRAASCNYGPDSFIGLVVGFQEMRDLKEQIEFIRYLEGVMPMFLDGVSRWNIEWNKDIHADDQTNSKRTTEYKQSVIVKTIHDRLPVDH